MSAETVPMTVPRSTKAATQRSFLNRRVAAPAQRKLFAPIMRHFATARLKQFAATGTAPGRIVLLGDSITQAAHWDEWLPDLPVINRGIAGDTCAQLLARLDTAINQPRAVALLIGTNDLNAGLSPHEIAQDVRRLLEAIERLAPGTPVLVQSVMPRQLKFRDEILEVNQSYRRLVDEEPGTRRYLDLWPALATSEGALEKRLTGDGLHLNASGYRTWTDVLRPALHDLMEKEKP